MAEKQEEVVKLNTLPDMLNALAAGKLTAESARECVGRLVQLAVNARATRDTDTATKLEEGARQIGGAFSLSVVLPEFKTTEGLLGESEVIPAAQYNEAITAWHQERAKVAKLEVELATATAREHEAIDELNALKQQLGSSSPMQAGLTPVATPPEVMRRGPGRPPKNPVLPGQV